MQKKVTSVRIEPELLARIDFLAKEEGRRKGDLINEAIRQYLDGSVEDGVWELRLDEDFQKSVFDELEVLRGQVDELMEDYRERRLRNTL